MRLARIALGVVIFAALLPPLGAARAHADGHAVAVTSPAPASLTAELYTPRGTGPFPAVILMHGCGGIGPNVKEWAGWLRHEGYAAFVLDSFGGRGLKRLCAGSAQLTGRMRAPDVFAAAAYLKTLPQIDSSRIAAIGYSHGGWTLLTSASTERQYPDVSIRAFILFYPSCGGFTKLPGSTPMLMLLGGKDDWAPAAPCEALAKSAAAAGRSVTAVVYPEARHHFDGAELRAAHHRGRCPWRPRRHRRLRSARARGRGETGPRLPRHAAPKMTVAVRFVGSGDAFGTGGRFQTCLHVSGADAAVLIDCGTSSLISMKRDGVDPGEVSAVLLSHLHGDHFGGVPFLILDAQFSRRTQPLVIAGPPGVRARVEAAMEVFFPGSTSIQRKFSVEFVELAHGQAMRVGPAAVTAFPVVHASGAPPAALRVEYGGRIIAYSGDTEWTESLVDVARGADLFVCEAYTFDKPVKFHLDYKTVEAQAARLGARRIILTHMGRDMLARAAEARFERAHDGLVVTV